MGWVTRNMGGPELGPMGGFLLGFPAPGIEIGIPAGGYPSGRLSSTCILYQLPILVSTLNNIF
jgi:hypothetical protein